MQTAKRRWLKNGEAARFLGVSVRTIRLWLSRSDTREALGGILHGKQCRIPRPDNVDHWAAATLGRLKTWERELQEIAKKDGHLLESYRFWIAVTVASLERGDLTQNARNAALLMWQIACEILVRLPRYEMDASRLKSEVRSCLEARKFSALEMNFIMDYWPDDEHFNSVRAALTLQELERIRRRMDHAQAVESLKQSGRKATGNLIRRRLHKNIEAHINDTGEGLPGEVSKPSSSDELRQAIKADVWAQMHTATPRRYVEKLDEQGRTIVCIEGANDIIDLRTPQDGLPLRTFRRRHPLREKPQRDIVATIDGVRDSIPGADPSESRPARPKRVRADQDVI